MTNEAMASAQKVRPVRGLARNQAAKIIERLDREIEWNIGRLGNLVMSDEDRQQTEDYIMDLRQERESLKRYFNV